MSSNAALSYSCHYEFNCGNFKHSGSFVNVCRCFLSYIFSHIICLVLISISLLFYCFCHSVHHSLSVTSPSLSRFAHLLSSAISSLWQRTDVSNANSCFISGRHAIIIFHCQIFLLYCVKQHQCLSFLELICIHWHAGDTTLCVYALIFLFMSVLLCLPLFSAIMFHARIWMDFVSWMFWPRICAVPAPFCIFTFCVCVVQEPQLWGASGASQSERDWSQPAWYPAPVHQHPL